MPFEVYIVRLRVMWLCERMCGWCGVWCDVWCVAWRGAWCGVLWCVCGVDDVLTLQEEGIKFMYECLMGMRSDSTSGVILGDAMGLGKTIQCIALLWTMLKQGPFTKPVVRRALIVCPGSLVNNWDKEFKKWLGTTRINVFAVNASENKVETFASATVYPVGHWFIIVCRNEYKYITCYLDLNLHCKFLKNPFVDCSF